jgi:hypothetical protein
MVKRPAAAIFFFLIILPSLCRGDMGRYFYHPKPYGSEAFYNPLNLSFAYALDTAQMPENFDTSHMGERWKKVREDLSHPFDAIESEGGTRAFINRQIFPVDRDNLSESWAMVPNYALHLFGGGMVYRKDAEYFQSQGYPMPRLLAASLAMTAEVVQEVIEKKSTSRDDEVADVYIFRPIGILLFSSDTVAEFVADRLSPAIWPYLLVYDVKEEAFMNTGISYVLRPKKLGNDDARFFSYIGLNNLVGLSHRTGPESELSWGMGLSTTRVDNSLEIPAEFRFSAGLFYDRNDSLIWSAVFNGTAEMKVRVNVYPLEHPPFNKFGLFAGLSDDHAFSCGIAVNFPVGVGCSF